MTAADQTTLAEETRCPVCLEVWEPEKLGDTTVCPACWKTDGERTDANMRKALGKTLPWEMRS